MMRKNLREPVLNSLGWSGVNLFVLILVLLVQGWRQGCLSPKTYLLMPRAACTVQPTELTARLIHLPRR
jgi:hypothetical protein